MEWWIFQLEVFASGSKWWRPHISCGTLKSCLRCPGCHCYEVEMRGWVWQKMKALIWYVRLLCTKRNEQIEFLVHRCIPYHFDPLSKYSFQKTKKHSLGQKKGIHRLRIDTSRAWLELSFVTIGPRLCPDIMWSPRCAKPKGSIGLPLSTMDFGWFWHGGNGTGTISAVWLPPRGSEPESYLFISSRWPSVNKVDLDLIKHTAHLFHLLRTATRIYQDLKDGLHRLGPCASCFCQILPLFFVPICQAFSMIFCSQESARCITVIVATCWPQWCGCLRWKCKH